MFRGDNAAFDLTVTKSSVPVDLSGCTLRFTAKLQKEDADSEAVISKVSSDADEILVTDAPAGEATVFVIPADTTAITEQTVLFYDVQVTDGAGKVHTLVTGKLKIKLDVTRAG
jgi:hypothetical protein